MFVMTSLSLFVGGNVKKVLCEPIEDPDLVVIKQVRIYTIFPFNLIVIGLRGNDFLPQLYGENSNGKHVAGEWFFGNDSRGVLVPDILE